MSVDKNTLITAIKAGVVPQLRQAGFKGSFPDFYRNLDGHVDLINFQFYSSGGSFCVNLSFADANRENVYFQPETPANRIKVSQTTRRHRLGAPKERGDCWYSFGKTSYGEFRGKPIPPAELVDTLNGLFATEAEDWWREERADAP